MTAARTLTDADIEAIRAIVRGELETRARRRARPADIAAAPVIVVDELTARRARAALDRHGLGRSKVRTK